MVVYEFMRHPIDYIDAPDLSGCETHEWRQTRFQEEEETSPRILFTEKNLLLCIRATVVHPFRPPDLETGPEGGAKTARF